MSYTFVKEIASGTYGKVSLVQQNGKSYADKEFFHHIDLNELDLLSRLHHPNIIQCKEFFKTDKFHIILELADADLTRVNFNVIPNDIKIKWCYQLTSALHFIHSQGYTHCDLKPQNILVKQTDVKIADLGLTFPVEMDTLCGTPLWSSYECVFHRFNKTDPEITSFFQNVPPINKMSNDIFGLGLLITLILTGKSLVGQYHHQYNKDDPLLIEKCYINYIQNYPNNIKELPLDEDWTDLIIQMCHPVNTHRIKTTTEILNNPAFVAKSYNIPIPGKVLKLDYSMCPYEESRDKLTANMFPWLSMMVVNTLQGRSPFLMMYVITDLYYRLAKLSIGHNDKYIQFYVILCYYIGVKLLIKNEYITPEALTKMGKGFEVKNLVHYYEKSIMELRGVIRYPSLYDKAVSKRECVFGLFCMLHCGINQSVHVEELHDNYVMYEDDDMTSRKSKCEDSEENDLKLITEDNINRFNSYSEEVLSKLGPSIVFRKGIEKREISKEMIEKREYEYNRLNDVEVTVEELQELMNKL